MIAFDVALRETGFFGMNKNGEIVYGTIKYKEKFSLEDYRYIKEHLEFLKRRIKENKEIFSSKIFVLESDTYGARVGGYKTKEIMTIARINLSYALASVFKKSDIIYVPNFKWKQRLKNLIDFKEENEEKGSKKGYVEVAKKVIKDMFSVELTNHNVIDAALIFLAFQDDYSPPP